jgi:protein O-GlcNAc transferase
LPDDKFIFANFNQLYKLDPTTFNVWMNILRRVDNSVLWLLEYPSDAKTNLWKEARMRGIDPERIIFTQKEEKHRHIERCALADLSLDNPVTNGHTTSTDLLWSGLPQVTFPISENMPSRVAASLSAALGCPEMITNSYTEYEETAVRWATKDHDHCRLASGVEGLPEHILRRPHGSLELKKLRHKIEFNRTTQPLFNT